MATYAIGDIQGCFPSLRKLLDKLNFDPADDQLWFAGDLVNRGPESLATLRFVKNLGKNAVTVLGNHDLHLLAIAADHKATRDKSIQAILDAADADDLINWLRQQPLLHADKSLGYVMVHAGIYPGWKLSEAKQHAKELQTVLSSDQYIDFIHHMYGNKPGVWSDDLQGWKRLRFICNSFTRMRYCDKKGKLNLEERGKPAHKHAGSIPWFEVPWRKPIKQRILFGHWSTLGLLDRQDVYALDTGCVWGGKLTALRIDKSRPRYTSIKCPEYRKHN